jgi:hypothetical protein
MRIDVLPIAGLLLLAGCGLSPVDTLNGTIQSAQDMCRTLYPDPYKKPVATRIRCLNNAVLDHATAMERATGNPLVVSQAKLAAAKLMVAAERFDNGVTTQAQFDEEKASANSEFNTAVVNYDNSQAAIVATKQAATYTPPPAIPQSRSVVCNGYGSTVTCY